MRLEQIIIFLLCFNFTEAQIIKSSDNKLPSSIEMIMQVKQFNQFIERFNYERTFDDKPIDSVFASQINRKQYINYLFNLSDKDLDSNLVYKNLKNSFIDEIIMNNLYLSKLLKNTYVVADCNVFFKGKKENLQLTLQKIVDKDSSSEWKIVSAFADFIKISSIKDTNVYIPPNANETNFMRICDLLSDKQLISSYFYHSYEIDYLSIFHYLLFTNQIELKNVKSINYYIFDIPNWIMVVSDFNRKSINSGWLISDLIHIEKNNKQDYLHNKLNIR